MTHWRAVNPADFGRRGWVPVGDYRCAESDMVVPVGAAELSRLIAHYPLCFIKQRGHYRLRALQSFMPGVNFFVGADGRWVVPYIPAHYRCYPFRLKDHPHRPGEKIVCVDVDYKGVVPCSGSSAVRAFFNDKGEQSPALSRVVEFLEKLDRERRLADRLVDQLAAAELMEPWAIKSKSSQKVIAGLYHINETALRVAQSGVLRELAETGALALAYGQLLSQVRRRDLDRLNQNPGVADAVPVPSALPEDEETEISFDLRWSGKSPEAIGE